MERLNAVKSISHAWAASELMQEKRTLVRLLGGLDKAHSLGESSRDERNLIQIEVGH